MPIIVRVLFFYIALGYVLYEIENLFLLHELLLKIRIIYVHRHDNKSNDNNVAWKEKLAKVKIIQQKMTIFLYKCATLHTLDQRFWQFRGGNIFGHTKQ